jgi:geranylgeranyl reductase family protein
MNRFGDFDVLIVGGGPIGGIVAEDIARNHLSTIILEEHKSIGQPEHCAGLISLNGLRKLGITPPRHLVLNEVRGSAIFSPNGENLTVERTNTQAFVMDRISLDQYLVEKATHRGSELQLNTKAKQVTIQPDGAIITAETSNNKKKKSEITLRSKLIISGEGAQAKLTTQMGLGIPNPKMKLYATQFEMSKVRLERDDLVEIYFGSFAPGFFAWVIPTGEDSARIGLASNIAKSHTFLKYFISHHTVAAPKLAKASLEKVSGGMVLTGGPSKATSTHRFLAVGDCAGQTKPTTGGGVVTGGLCAKIASRVAVESVTLEDFSDKFLRRYDRMWQSQLGQEFFSMLRLRRILNHLPNSLLDKSMAAAKRSGLEKVIENKGDIDAQSQLIKSVLMNPRTIISFLLSFLGLQ